LNIISTRNFIKTDLKPTSTVPYDTSLPIRIPHHNVSSIKSFVQLLVVLR